MGKHAEYSGAGDGDLVHACRAGSQAAFAELYRRHAGAVRRVLSDNVHDVERQRDLVQETFTRALAKLHSLNDPAQFRPWVFQIARNAAIDDLRSRRRVTLEPFEEDDRGAHADPDGSDAVVELRALAEAIKCGLAALSPRDATAVSLVVHLGFGPEELAAALGISYGNAKVVLHRARTRLRGVLEQQELLMAPDPR